MFKKYIRFLIILLFLAVPLFSSFISTIHLIDMFELGNPYWISLVLAIVYEVGSLAAFVTPFVFHKINKPMIFSVFSILVFLQVLGNVYYSFNYINIHLKLDPNWLSSFRELLTYFIGNDLPLIKIIVSSLISIPIPLISLFFLKSVIDYIDPEKEVNLKSTTDYLKEDIELKEETKIDIKPLEELLQPKEIEKGDTFIPIPVHENIREWPEDDNLEEELTVKQHAFEESKNMIKVEEPKVFEEEIKKENIYNNVQSVDKINHKETTTVSSPDMIFNNNIKKV